MKKRVAWRKLNRTGAHKWSMLRNMVSSLIEHERIVTTEAKAKEMRTMAEKMVTLAKGQTLHDRRRAAAFVRGDATLVKLFEVLGPRYEHREGGYTRVMKLSKRRAGDNAPMAVIEYVDRPGEIRAARPPAKIQKALDLGGINEALRALGIEPKHDLSDENESEKEEEEEEKEEISTNEVSNEETETKK